MPAFVDVAGVAMTAHKHLLRDVLRVRWGFNGLIVSDYNAIAELINHGVAADLSEAGALALKAGVDIDMMGDAYNKGLPDALARGDVTLDDIHEALVRVLNFKELLASSTIPIAASARTSRKACKAAGACARSRAEVDGSGEE